MNRQDEPRREIEALRDRISRLSAASLRINASLDLDTILSEVVESARALTGARYGAITTIGDSGPAENVVTSGFTLDEHCDMLHWEHGLRLFEHFRDLQDALRVKDLPGFVRSLGLSPAPILPRTGQGTAMRHRGVHVGNFFLAGKDGEQEFTSEDEEVLVLLASQAAVAIANARTYRDEHRARTDLEALIETSPVGVGVFDAATGRPISSNREANRIVSRLRIPDRPPEYLLEVMTCRFSDGREIALTELPIARVLSGAETVRAEQVELSVPDGRRVSMLINATPIQSAEGVVESVIVTMQDLAPLEELERSRADFLSMVTHELRAPLTSIKGSATTLLEASSDLDPAEMHELFRIIADQTDHMRGLISDLLDAGRINSGTLSVSPESSELTALVDRARNTFLSGGGRQTVLIDFPPDLPRVMADRRRIVQVLNNLFSNAAWHAPVSSPIRVAAERDGAHVKVFVSDQGRGVRPERLPHLFQKYAGGDAGDGRRGLAGTGLGLAICKGLVEAHGGRIKAESDGLGKGTRITFTIPVAEDAVTDLPSAPSRPGLRRNTFEKVPILVVDDDPLTLRHVRGALTAAGYAPIVTGDPHQLSRIIKEKKPRLVVLDLMLPETDGIELMQQIPELADLPVIFISAYSQDEMVARALEAGAVDYIVKPFSTTELTARIRAALRRRSEPNPILLGPLAILYEQRQVSVAGQPVELTPSEYELLRLLSLKRGQVLTYQTLVRQVSGKHCDHDARVALRSLVKNLRRKLGDDASNPAYILNERGVGYRMPDFSDPGRP